MLVLHTTWFTLRGCKKNLTVINKWFLMFSDVISKWFLMFSDVISKCFLMFSDVINKWFLMFSDVINKWFLMFSDVINKWFLMFSDVINKWFLMFSALVPKFCNLAFCVVGMTVPLTNNATIRCISRCTPTRSDTTFKSPHRCQLCLLY